ncbi:MAG: RNA-binding S4 domain-containing protein [Caldimonas sp.]|uniref:RNA-binding S4 domain-containing protein n=1 Tax=Caldimonas sp. TaxID=2838790 RepID=UPI00391A785D
MTEIDFELRGDHIALHALLKLVGAAGSGGQGKAQVAAGRVEVDGRPETRKSAKIRAGQVVAIDDLRIHVKAHA